MTDSFDFISSEDKPALLAFSTPEWLETAKAALQELGYKVHTAATHTDFVVRFSQFHYQVVIIEELFGANTIDENLTLHALQAMPVSQRRHATVILLGDSFQTFTPMEAFKHSVHAVINSSRNVSAQTTHRKGRRRQLHCSSTASAKSKTAFISPAITCNACVFLLELSRNNHDSPRPSAG